MKASNSGSPRNSPQAKFKKVKTNDSPTAAFLKPFKSDPDLLFIEEFSKKHLPFYTSSSNFLPKERKINSEKVLSSLTKELFAELAGNVSKTVVEQKRDSSSSSHRIEFSVNILLDNEHDTTSFQFGKPGWVCASCVNFNYKMRKRCNRCSKPRSLLPNAYKPIEIKERLATEKKESTPKDWICFLCKKENDKNLMKCKYCKNTE